MKNLIEDSSSAVESSTYAFLASNFILQIVLSSSLNLIWSMMNTLQIIVYMPLMHLSMPDNAYITSLIFLNLANFDIFPSKFLYEGMFTFDSEKMSFGSRFVNLGFVEMGFLINSGSILWFLVVWLLLVSIYYIIKQAFKNSQRI